MSTITKSSPLQVLSKAILVVVCALCLQPLCGCESKTGEQGVIDHIIRYASARVMLDMATSSVVVNTPDAKVDFTVMSTEDTPNGVRAIKIEPAVISDTMASWGADEWAANRDDLYFNLVAHFNVICKQAHEFGDVPENYEMTYPGYVVVYDSQKKTGVIVTPTGVYQKTNDPENPIGEPIVLTD